MKVSPINANRVSPKCSHRMFSMFDRSSGFVISLFPSPCGSPAFLTFLPPQQFLCTLTSISQEHTPVLALICPFPVLFPMSNTLQIFIENLVSTGCVLMFKILKSVFICVYECFTCICVCVPYACSALKGQKRTLDRSLQAIVEGGKWLAKVVL